MIDLFIYPAAPQVHNKTYSTNSSRSDFVYKPIMSHITTMENRKSMNLFVRQISIFGGQITLLGESLFYLFGETELTNAKWQK